ncbi:hypothetical protein, partial [Adlercreutzia sp. DFI.6.23]|uniref:hypothetical protein n=1 Tax=Adlercreutzia sp. DFI.6.23 TaxID=2963705 RepID=UPI00210D842E
AEPVDRGERVLRVGQALDELGVVPLAAQAQLADQPRMPDGSKVPGGFSKGKHCIGIGCDGSGASVFADEGLGKTSGTRTLAAFGGHVARGSTLVHDMENGHNRLVRELGLRGERVLRVGQALDELGVVPLAAQ